MNLNMNNNNRIIYRIARNNLIAKKMSSLIIVLSILLAMSLVSTLVLFIIGTQTAEKQALSNMQHVMYMDITKGQMKNIASDEKTEICVPYKHREKEFQTDGVKYNFLYFESHGEKIRTYVLDQGKTPDKYNEIVVDKAFMKALGRESTLGASISLDVDGVTENFTVSGYTDDAYSVLTHPIKVSKAFAEQSALMKDLPYTALVRLKDVSDIPVSTFTTAVYQIAMDYEIERPKVNINGKFELWLQSGNSGLYTVLLVSFEGVIISVSGITETDCFELNMY